MNKDTKADTNASKRKTTPGQAQPPGKRYKKAPGPPNVLEEHERNAARRLELQTELGRLKAPFNGEIKFAQIRDLLDYVKALFPRRHFPDLPPIVYLNQVYSLVRNRTDCDREIELLRSSGQVRLFKSDSKEHQGDDVFICFCDDLRVYLETVVLPAACTSEQSSLAVRLYMGKILPQTSEMFIKRSELKAKFKLQESDVTTLIQLGLLATKDAADLWFSIPGVGKFRRISLESRRQVVNLLRKKKYHEVNVEELIKRHMKSTSQLGVPYLCLDLIGSGLVKRVDSPLEAFIIQLL